MSTRYDVAATSQPREANTPRRTQGKWEWKRIKMAEFIRRFSTLAAQRGRFSRYFSPRAASPLLSALACHEAIDGSRWQRAKQWKLLIEKTESTVRRRHITRATVRVAQSFFSLFFFGVYPDWHHRRYVGLLGYRLVEQASESENENSELDGHKSQPRRDGEACCEPKKKKKCNHLLSYVMYSRTHSVGICDGIEFI